MSNYSHLTGLSYHSAYATQKLIEILCEVFKIPIRQFAYILTCILGKGAGRDKCLLTKIVNLNAIKVLPWDFLCLLNH